jgi:ArsR family transcriptional regulator
VEDSTTVELTAARFRALGDPTRLRVVRELAGGTRCVCELRARVDVPGPLLSHHLAVLRDTGLITATRRGRWIDYTLDRETLATLDEALGLTIRGDAIGARS